MSEQTDLSNPNPGRYTQLVLGLDPFPYKDLNPTSRYSQSVVPDDWIPTISQMVGLNNLSQGRIPQVDDQRRLHVFDENSGGGGGGVTPVVMNDSFFAAEPTTEASPNYDITSIYIGNILYGFQLALGMEAAVNTNSNNGYFRYYLKNSSGGQINLYVGQMYDIGFGQAGILQGWNKTVMFPIPRDLTEFLSVDRNFPDVWIEIASHIPINVGGVFWSS